MKRTGTEADQQWPRILKKIGGAGGSSNAVTVTGSVPWANVSKAGSSLAHLAARDHDLLAGLGDDDHSQYVHVSAARTISAQHNFTAGLTSPVADTASQLGLAHVGYVGHGVAATPGVASYAGFAHRDYATPGGYALLQGSSGFGHTLINAPPGFTIRHRINNIDALALNENVLELHSISGFKTFSFTSGFTGNGFRIDNGVLTPGKTTGEIDDLIVRGRMRVYELLVQQIRATNGSIFVSSTGKVKAVTGSGPYSIETDATHGFLVNDLIRAQRFTGNGVYQSNLQVTAVANLTNFTASLISGDAPAAGMEFVRLGNTSDSSRQNSLYMSADDTYNPFIDVITGVNSFAAFGSTAARKIRIGNLQGLFGVAGEYGIFAGDGLGATSKYMRLSSYTQELRNLPINMYDGSGTLFLTLSTGGLAFAGTNQSYARVRWSAAGGAPDYDIGAYTHGDSYNRMDLRSWSASNSAVRVGAWNSGQVNSPVAYVEVSQASFASKIALIADGVGVGITSPSYKLHIANGGTTGLIVDGSSRFGQGGTWGAIDGPSFGWIGFGANFYYSGNQAKYRAANYASMMFCSSDIVFYTASSGATDGNIAWSQKMTIANSGNVGIGTAAPEDNLHVATGVRVRNGSGGFVAIKPGDANNIGYIEWYKANATRTAYLGYGSGNLNLVLENSSVFYVGNGNTWFGNTSDLFGAKIQTSGNIHAQGVVTSDLYWQVAATTPPGAATGYCRVTLRSSDNALVAVMPSGAVRVLAVN
jgi:hypothetical protein